MFNPPTPVGAILSPARPYREVAMRRIDPSLSSAPSDPEGNAATDCPECGGRSTVRGGICEICYAEFDEYPLEPIDYSLDLEPLI